MNEESACILICIFTALTLLILAYGYSTEWWKNGRTRPLFIHKPIVKQNEI